MANEPNPAWTAAAMETAPLPARQVYLMAGLCLVVGLAIGVLCRGVVPAESAGQPVAGRTRVPAGHTGSGGMPSPAEMKQMADTQAAPLLEKLKSDPTNSALLMQIAAIYHRTGQYTDSAAYYNRAVQADPKNVANRTKLAASLYRKGDVDGAIAELNRALSEAPNDANALFNLGLIRLNGKQDNKGALAAWQQLLKTNPQLSADRKAQVQALMAHVEAAMGGEHGIEGARGNGGHTANAN